MYWSPRLVSNQRPIAYRAIALTTELLEVGKETGAPGGGRTRKAFRPLPSEDSVFSGFTTGA